MNDATARKGVGLRSSIEKSKSWHGAAWRPCSSVRRAGVDRREWSVQRVRILGRSSPTSRHRAEVDAEG